MVSHMFLSLPTLWQIPSEGSISTADHLFRLCLLTRTCPHPRISASKVLGPKGQLKVNGMDHYQEAEDCNQG